MNTNSNNIPKTGEILSDIENNIPPTGPDFNALEKGIEAMRTTATDTINAAAEHIAAGIEASAETLQSAAEATAATAEKVGDAAAGAAEAVETHTRTVDKSVLVTFFVIWSLVWMVVCYYGVLAASALAGPVAGPVIFLALTLVLCLGPVTGDWMSKMVKKGMFKLQDLVDDFKARKAAKLAQQKKNLDAAVASFAEQATAAA